MAVIRQSSQTRIARDAIVLDLGDLARQGERMRSHAREQADDIIEEARRERVRLLEGAERQGFEAGLAKGLEEGLKQGMEEGRAQALAEHSARLAEVEAMWAAGLGSFENERAAILTEAGRDILRLAAMLGEQVVKRTIELHPGVVTDQLAAVLSIVGAGHTLRLQMNPADVEVSRSALPGLISRFAPGTHAQIEEDPSLLPGSCVAISDQGGVVDASVQTQLARLIEVLMPDHGHPAGFNSLAQPDSGPGEP
ncbi:MAG: hypothetical protein KF864_12080 [Phycisphaeraceae bacterium]|nr:hypothetical protein [Phycisphaeraceae bacterium]